MVPSDSDLLAQFAAPQMSFYINCPSQLLRETRLHMGRSHAASADFDCERSTNSKSRSDRAASSHMPSNNIADRKTYEMESIPVIQLNSIQSADLCVAICNSVDACQSGAEQYFVFLEKQEIRRDGR